jgi:hypothetical protein
VDEIFYRLETNFRSRLLRNCDMEHIDEAKMSLFHVGHSRDRLATSLDCEQRLPPAQAAMLITALSVLCWAIIAAIIIGLRAVV